MKSAGLTFLRSLFVATIALHVVSAYPEAVNAEKQWVTITIDDEPPSLNSMTTTDAYSIEVLVHIMEGLVQYAPDGSIIPAVAERWQVDDRGARFWLRRDARWSDGKSVTAHDFVFAWQQVVAPATGSQYAFIMEPIKHAAEIVRGELPPDALGVRAVNDYELEVIFARPCPYFASLTAAMTFFPARRDMVEKWGRAYAADADKSLYNGPFQLTRWVHAAELLLERNPHYWNSQGTRLNRIHYAYITKDELAKYNLFRNGDTAYTVLTQSTIQSAVDSGFTINQFQTGSLFFMEFNHRPGRVMANLSLRRAIQAVYDPLIVTNKLVGRPGTLPGRSLFPMTVRGKTGRFRDEYPAPEKPLDLAAARAHLQRAKDELGMQSLPPLDLLTSDTQLGQQQAEYVQHLLRRALGLDVRINKQSFKQFIALRKAGRFDFSVGSGWGPDYDDAMTFADLFASWNSNNRGRYHNPAYDAAVRRAQNSGDPDERFAAFAEIQRIVVDDVVIIPIWEEVENYLQHPKLRGLYRPVFGGDLNLRFAWIEE